MCAVESVGQDLSVQVLPLKYQGRLLCWWLLETGQAPICCENSRLRFSWHMSTFALTWCSTSIAFWCFLRPGFLGLRAQGQIVTLPVCAFQCPIPTRFRWLQRQIITSTWVPKCRLAPLCFPAPLKPAFAAALPPWTKYWSWVLCSATMLLTAMWLHTSSLKGEQSECGEKPQRFHCNANSKDPSFCSEKSSIYLLASSSSHFSSSLHCYSFRQQRVWEGN